MPNQLRVHLCAALLLLVPCLVIAQEPALEPRTLAPTPTPSVRDVRPVLQERQFLCGLFGNCRTTTIIEPGVAPSSSSSSAVDSPTSSSASTVSSTSSTTSSTLSSTSSASTESSSASSSSSAVSSSSSSSSSASTSSSASSTSSATSSSASSSLSQSIVTITSIVTNSDGTSSTITSASSSAVAVPVQNDSKNGSLSGKTWGIIGGIVGGVAALILGIFVFWKVAKRCSNNRAMDQIAWPELQNDASGGAFSTLNPQGTRRTGGAGFEMGKDHRGDGQYYDDEEEEDHAGEIRRGGWASPRAMSPRLAYDPRMSGQFYGLGGDGQYGYGNEYGQPTPMAHGNYYPYRQEAPLPPLPPGAAAGSARPTLPHLPLGSDPSSARHPGGPLPFPGSPVHSFEMAHEPTYPPRSGRPYSGSAEDAYGGYAAGISTDDVPLTATAQPPAGGGGAGPNIPYAGSAGQQHGYRY